MIQNQESTKSIKKEIKTKSHHINKQKTDQPIIDFSLYFQKPKPSKYNFKGMFEKIEYNDFIQILQFLNIIELVKCQRTCRFFSQISKHDEKIYNSIDFANLNSKIKITSINFIRILGRVQNLEGLTLANDTQASDISFILMNMNKLKYLQLNNINLDFAKSIVNIRINTLQSLELNNNSNNVKGRVKAFDENELKQFKISFPNLQNLIMNNNPIFDKEVTFLLTNFQNLRQLSLKECPNLTNEFFLCISKMCSSLVHLEIGGSATQYNFNFSIEGFQSLQKAKFQLEYLRLEFICKVGNKIINFLSNRFKSSLKQLHIVRNNFEKCAKINQEAFKDFIQVTGLEELSVVYVRQMGDNFHEILYKNFPKLQKLCLQDCPIQEDLSLLALGCPELIEVDLSGDSWVKQNAFVGLGKHPNIRILRLGHYQHADTNCDSMLKENSPKQFILDQFSKKDTFFPKLSILYLEQECSLTFWLDKKIKSCRTGLTIKYSYHQKLFQSI